MFFPSGDQSGMVGRAPAGPTLLAAPSIMPMPSRSANWFVAPPDPSPSVETNLVWSGENVEKPGVGGPPPSMLGGMPVVMSNSAPWTSLYSSSESLSSE
jgi:hypothetical protein